MVRGVWLRSGLMDDSPAMAARTNTPTSRFKEEKGRGKPRRGQWEGRDEAQKSLCLTSPHWVAAGGMSSVGQTEHAYKLLGSGSNVINTLFV